MSRQFTRSLTCFAIAMAGSESDGLAMALPAIRTWPVGQYTMVVAAEKVLQYCIDIGGTLTGEHGVGVEKIHLMPYLFDEPTMHQFQLVKDAFDPDDRINAGKLLPSPRVEVHLLKPGRHVPQ